MGPLKQMTHCGSISALFAVLIVLFGVSSSALTTFGKSNTGNQQAPPTPPPVVAKSCSGHGDCGTIQNTSCVLDPIDDRMRCLCGDFKAPVNGLCTAKYKGLRHLCMESAQCDYGMMCAIENTTKTTTTLVMSKTFPISNMLNGNGNSSYKVCLCDEEADFFENKHERHCSGTVVTVISGALIPLVLLLLGTTIANQPANHWSSSI
ncbi:uncharacterized protein LOC125951891 [Anopheles darlingi]|uniref:Putative agap001637-pa-like protein n=1 Tax=Anopheles darlingi TaxID=43151 RepID=A0A087ZIG5_ANODA|nr:uncharacterized protein LOC125951891 [Anopheles darlingi]